MREWRQGCGNGGVGHGLSRARHRVSSLPSGHTALAWVWTRVDYRVRWSNPLWEAAELLNAIEDGGAWPEPLVQGYLAFIGT